MGFLYIKPWGRLSDTLYQICTAFTAALHTGKKLVISMEYINISYAPMFNKIKQYSALNCPNGFYEEKMTDASLISQLPSTKKNIEMFGTFKNKEHFQHNRIDLYNQYNIEIDPSLENSTYVYIDDSFLQKNTTFIGILDELLIKEDRRVQVVIDSSDNDAIRNQLQDRYINNDNLTIVGNATDYNKLCVMVSCKGGGYYTGTELGYWAYFLNYTESLRVEDVILEEESNIVEINNIKVPKVFHFIWIGNNEIPEEYIKYINSWRKINPGWMTRIWTNKDLTYENFSNLHYILKSKKYAQQADIMRYEILYKYGGIYLDTDFECYKNIETLLIDYDFFTCNGDHDSTNQCVISMGLYGSKKNNIISKSLVDNIKYVNTDSKDINVETGPFYFGKIVNNYLGMFKEIYPRYFYPNTYKEFFYNIDVSNYRKNAYGEHHWSNSWNKENILKVYVKPKYIIYTSEYVNESYGGVSTVVYNMFLSLTKYYKVYIILNPYQKPNYFNLIDNNGAVLEAENLESILDFINIQSNDICITHNCERVYIYNKLLNYTQKCYLMCHGYYDINLINKITSKSILSSGKTVSDIYIKNENILNNYDKIICLNPEFAKKLSAKYQTKEIYYIPNCVNINNSIISHKSGNSNINYNGSISEFSISNLYETLYKINPIIKFIYVGRIEEYKNVHTLIDAIKDIKNVSLTLIGPKLDNIFTNYENIIYIEKLNNNECIECMKAHDVLINISLFECFPMVLLEAGINKLCCYISNLSGFSDIFKDTCIYAKNHYNAGSVKNDLLQLINNPKLIKIKGQELYDLIIDNYNLEKYHQYLYQLEIN